MKQVMIAISCGVDSCVAACLVKKTGRPCVGVIMRLSMNTDVGIPKGHPLLFSFRY